MRPTKLTRPLLFGAVVVSAASCQLVAGVETDGELRSEASSASSGGATSASSTEASTSDASTSTSGTYMGPLCANVPCDAACVLGSCVVPSCTAGPVFDVFTPADLDGAELANALPVAVRDAHAVVAVTDIDANQLIIRAVDANGNLSLFATYPLGLTPHFEQARLESGLAFQGFMNDELGEILVDYSGVGSPTNPTFVSFGKPAPCGASEAILRVSYTENEFGETAYAANCAQDGVAYRLVIGVAGGMAEEIGSAVNGKPDSILDAYAFAGGNHIILTGNEYGRFYRAGATALALSTANSYQLGNSGMTPASTFFLAELPPGLGPSLGYYGADVGSTETTLWAGAFTDPAILSLTPPAGFTPVGQPLSGADLDAKIGKPSQASSNNDGVFMAMRTHDGIHVTMSWFYPDGTPLLLHDQVYEASLGGNVAAASVAPIGLNQVVVMWIEDVGGATQVRGRVETCDLERAM